jgi:alpha-N-arabinofuranosidase
MKSSPIRLLQLIFCFIAQGFLLALSCACVAVAQDAGGALAGPAPVAHLSIDTNQILHPVSPMLYGLMTEEINHSYEGGLYAELISNNTFQGNWMGVDSWGVVQNGNARVAVAIDKTDGPSASLPRSLKIDVQAASADSPAGISNPGFWGIALQPHTVYHGSFYAKTGDAGTLTARLVSDDTAAVVATAEVSLHRGGQGGWSRYEFTLSTGAITASTHNHLELTLSHPGTLWLQLVTLFPPTYDNRLNGNRPDLMKRMAAMHPHFLRLPGGNYLEGDTMADWYNWQKTIGPLVDRPGHPSPWSYWSTDQFGLLEFLEWTEDLHIEPVLAVYAGYALQHDYAKPGPDLAPYVQAALDEVEYATGDVSTKWGAERAKDGHPAPFPLHYIEIGNEDQFDKSGSYDGRFAQFALALRAKYPQYKLIATTPVKEQPGAEPDVLDDHYYKSPEDMLALTHKYDDAPRTGPKIFVGEWATRSGSPTPNFGDALGDAAWMTGLERNSDLIVMASYAPLLVNVNPLASQWPTDLIGYDGLTSYGSPSYYAQVMFAAHIGDGVPKSAIDLTGDAATQRFFYSATISSSDHVLHLKLVNATTTAQPLAIALDGLAGGAHSASVIALHAATFQATNSITAPQRIMPVESAIHFNSTLLKHTVPAMTIEVLDIPLH